MNIMPDRLEKRALDIVTRLSESSVDGRSQRLLAECGNDDALRAAVERLWASHQAVEQGSFLNRPAIRDACLNPAIHGQSSPDRRITDPNDPQTESVRPATDSQLRETVIGPDPSRTGSGAKETTGARSPSHQTERSVTRIGRYRVVGELGKGAFGQVFLAQDDDLGRPVAVKLLTQSSAGKLEAKRESGLLAAMRHPGIAEIFDVGCDADGRSYLVTRFIDGQTLSKRLTSGPVDSIQCARWVLQIAKALQHAHSQRITHRDIKPSNLMITSSNDAVVLDFGVALTDSDLRSAVDYSGTPAWMSPEQAAGRGTDIDGRSDIFSLGCVFYEMLTGVQAFRGDTVTETLGLIQTSEPRPPRQIRADRPVELEAICLKCLQKRREDRYATAADLATALENAIGKLERKPLVQRITPVVITTAVVAVAAILAIVWWPNQPAVPEPIPEAASPGPQVTEETAPLDEIRRIIALMEAKESRRNAGLSESGEPDQEPGEENGGESGILVFPGGFDDLQQELQAAVNAEDPDREFSVLLKASNAMIQERHYAIAEQVTRRMVAISEGDQSKYPIACGELGLALYKREKFAEAVKWLMKAITIYQQIYDDLAQRNAPEEHLSQLARMLGISWMRIGNAHKFAGQFDDAREAYRKTMQLCEKHDRDKELLTLLLNLGSMESMQGNYVMARALLTQGIQLADRLKDHQGRAEFQLNLANAHSRGGDNAAAIRIYEEVDDVSKELDSYELRSRLLLNFAESLLEENRTAEAREKLLELKRILRPGDTDAETALKLLPKLQSDPKDEAI